MIKYVLFLVLVSISNIHSQYLSDKNFQSRTSLNLIYNISNATNGINRSSNSTFNKKWIIAMYDFAGGNKSYFNQTAINSSKKLNSLASSEGIGTSYIDGIWEWGYSFYNLPGGNSTVNPSSYNNSISSKSLAYNNIFDWVKNSLNTKWSQKSWLSSVNGFYNFNHLGLDASNTSQYVDVVGSEVGENITGTSLQMAFTRGAARQFQKPWMIDLSSWFGGGQGTGVRDYTAFMTEVAQNVASVDLTNNRLGVRMKNGDILIKEGAFNTNWITVANNMTQFDIENNRIAVLAPNGDLLMKEGAVNSNYSLLAQSVSKFQLKGNRVGIIIGSFLAIKEPYSNSNWTNFGVGYKDFHLSPSRASMITTTNVLKAQQGNLSSTIYTISSDVKSSFMTDNILAYIKNNNDLFWVNGALNNSSIKIDGNVASVKVYNNRIVYLKNDSTLWLSTNGGTPILLGTQVKDFELDGNRIAKILTNLELYILTGTNYNYLNTAYTDEGFRFVSQNIKTVALDPSSNKLGLLSSSIYSNLFVKANPLYLNEAGLPTFWNEGGCAAGHSNSLTKRIQFAAYFNGANIFQTEASNINYFLGAFKDTGNSYLSLSPLGKVGQEFYQFTHNVMPNRGIPYQPVAIMLPREHGINYKTWTTQPNWVFNHIYPNNADLMNKALLKSIWGATLNSAGNTEEKYLGNSPFGDLFDIVTQDCPANVINQYPMVIVSGDWYPNTAERQKLKDYVYNGGNLVVSAAQRGSFTDAELGSTFGTPFGLYISNCSAASNNFSTQNPISAYVQDWIGTGPGPSTVKLMKCNNNNDVAAFSNKVGNGNVILVAPLFLKNESLWTLLLQQLVNQPQITPFSFNGDAYYTYTFEGDSIWNIMMINNKGVNKSEATSMFETIDETQKKNAVFTLQEKNTDILSVKDVTNNWAAYPFSGNSISCILEPGEVKVLQVKTKKILLKSVAAISQVNSLEEIYAYPNPTSGILKFSGVKSEIKIEIYTIDGKKIMEKDINENDPHLDLQNLQKGLYITVISSEQIGKKTIKVFKE